MANRNRTAGHNWEREVRNDLKELGWKDAETSRYASRKMDDLKVDLINTEPFYIQCKVSNKKLDFCKILEEMPNDSSGIINIVAAKMTSKSGKRFMTKDKLVIMKYNDFLNLLEDTLKSKVNK